MIPHTDLDGQALSWQQELAEALRSPQQLLSYLGHDAGPDDKRSDAASDFPMLVPRPFANRMKCNDPTDPLLLQVLPTGAEMDPQPGYLLDPLEERRQNPLPGLIHKYQGRVLLIAAAGCAVNCRYCFRRHFNYNDNKPAREDWPQTLAYIAADPSIKEVILSGGDPLLVSDRNFSDLIEQIAAIEHVQRLRIHSRLPVVLPSRVTEQLCAVLARSRLRCVLVIHCNHPQEIDSSVARAMAKLAAAGVVLLNQSVLLAGINDSAPTLSELSEALFAIGVMPYYLHLLDPVRGAAHFDIDEQRALVIYRELLSTNSGYLVPKLVRECPDSPSKVPLTPFLQASGGATSSYGVPFRE